MQTPAKSNRSRTESPSSVHPTRSPAESTAAETIAKITEKAVDGFEDWLKDFKAELAPKS